MFDRHGGLTQATRFSRRRLRRVALHCHSGEIELYIRDTAGQKIFLKVAGEDDIFGEISMFDNRPRSATATALIDAQLFVLDRDDLLLLFQKKPDAGLNMLAAMSGCFARRTICYRRASRGTSMRK